jgi:hypothetical protein
MNLRDGRTHSASGVVASPTWKLVDPSSSDCNQIISFPSPSQCASPTALELLNNVEEPVERSITQRPYLREWVVKLYVEVVYRARVPSEFGRAVPRRGALSIAAGVKIEELDVALTETTIMNNMKTRVIGDLVNATILTIFLEMSISKQRSGLG